MPPAPLTKDDVRCVPPEDIEEHGCECCCKNEKVFLSDKVVSAVKLLREKVFTTTTNWRGLIMPSTAKSKVLQLIDETFPRMEEK